MHSIALPATCERQHRASLHENKFKGRTSSSLKTRACIGAMPSERAVLSLLSKLLSSGDVASCPCNTGGQSVAIACADRFVRAS